MRELVGGSFTMWGFLQFILWVAAPKVVVAQNTKTPSTFPHDYPGKPTGDFSPAWQNYYEVKDPLPGVKFPLQRSFAGNIPVNRNNHPNCTLFFWAFEKKNGSLTPSGDSSDPWVIWLNGGPGASSLYGLFIENGPLHIANDLSVVHNRFSWSNLSDVFWIDQPVGTGFSTSDSTGYIANEDQMAEDFLGFLTNLVKIFPSLAKRPLYLTGESYAGTYIPYIAKALFSTASPPVNLVKFAIGDGAIGSITVIAELSTVSVIETYPQLIGFDTEVYSYFKSQQQLCGYDIKLTYPQNGIIPTIPFILPSGTVPFLSRVVDGTSGRSRFRNLLTHFASLSPEVKELMKRNNGLLRRGEHVVLSRSLAGRTNGSIDAKYGCDSLSMLYDYATNFTFPWTLGGIDIYDVPDALFPEAPTDASNFLNDNRTRTAIHAPTSKDWALEFNYPFGGKDREDSEGNTFGDPSDPPMVFLSELFANASSHNVDIILYSGNDDMLVAHRGTELTIQNTTWGGVQGFAQPPSTPWFNDRGVYAGIVHQERNLTYVLFKGAGHTVPQWQPENAFVFFREFVLGKNNTGLYDPNSKKTVGGVNNTLEQGGVMVEYDGAIFYGSGTTLSSTVFPSATIDAWKSFIVTGSSATIPVGTNSPRQTGMGYGLLPHSSQSCLYLVLTLIAVYFL